MISTVMLNLKCIPGKRGKHVVLILYLIAVLLNVPAYSIDIPVGMDAPDFSLLSSHGRMVSLADYKGNVLVLIYVRMDQGRSLQALKDGKEMFEQFKDKGVDVVGITADESMNNIHKIIIDHNIPYPVLLDQDRYVYGAYGIRVYPTTVIIGRNGKIAYAIPSHPLTYKLVLEGHVRHILGEIDEKKMLKIESPPQNERIEESALIAHRQYNLALKFTEERLIDMAVKAVTKSLEADKGSSQSHVLLGFLYLEENATDKALEEFNEALNLNPLSHDAKTGLGGALISKGDIDKAIEVLTEAASTNPYPEMTYYELGRAYEIKGEDSKSKEMYKNAIQKIIHKKVIPSAVSRCR